MLPFLLSGAGRLALAATLVAAPAADAQLPATAGAPTPAYTPPTPWLESALQDTRGVRAHEVVAHCARGCYAPSLGTRGSTEGVHARGSARARGR